MISAKSIKPILYSLVLLVVVIKLFRIKKAKKNPPAGGKKII